MAHISIVYIETEEGPEFQVSMSDTTIKLSSYELSNLQDCLQFIQRKKEKGQPAEVTIPIE